MNQKRNRFLIKYGLGQKKLLFKGSILTLMAVAFDLTLPMIISHIMDVELRDLQKLNWNAIYILLFAYLVLSIASSFTRYRGIVYLEMTSNKIVEDMRVDIYRHLNRLPIRYFDTTPVGKVVSKVMNDTEAIKNLYVVLIREFTTGFLYMVGIYCVLFYQHFKFALISLIFIPVTILCIAVYAKYSSKYNHEYRKKLSELNSLINESIQGISVIRAFQQEQKSKEEYENISEAWREELRKLVFLESVMSFNLTGILRELSFAFIIYYFGFRSIANPSSVSVGQIYVFIDYLSKLFIQIQNIMNKMGNTEKALVASEKILEFMQEEEMNQPTEKKENVSLAGSVSFEGIWFSYTDKPVLQDVSFHVNKGEMIAFVGHTGSGKSTIINLILQYYDPNRGKILFDGIDSGLLPKETIRKDMAIVLQDPYLFTGDIYSNISLGNSRISPEQAEQALIRVGGESFLKELPKGIYSPVLEKGNTFSSGQRQLISFARALAHDPKILILDEATSNIDTETEVVIQNAMNVLKQGRSTFVVAHRLSTIKQANKILVLQKGRIAEAGTHEELLEKQGLYYHMYMTQTKQSA